MIARLALFGAGGDLAGRYLLPALAALHEAGRLPEGFEVVGAATQDWDDEAFRGFASQRLEEHAAAVAAGPREALVRALRYRRADVTDAGSVAEVVGGGDGPVAAYLALPPAVYEGAITALGDAGLPPGSRVVLEKPFGESLEDAVGLNALLARTIARPPAGEDAVFRADHVLGMATVQNLLALRASDPVLEALWSSAHIAEVDVLWEETLALEGRAGFYDGTGALRDVLQNHAMQVLAVVAMEPPPTVRERDVRDAKVQALRTVRPPQAGDRSRRARYTAGRLSGTGGAADRPVPAYVDEDGVDASRGTETFAEILLDLDSPRWRGTRFRLRAGKALARRRKGVVVRFRASERRPFGPGAPPQAAELRIGIDGPLDVALQLGGSAPGPHPEPAPLTLASAPYEGELPAYARVLLDVLDGDGALSVRGDEAEEAWRIVTPVLDAWAEDRVPMDEYAAGSEGPPPLGAPAD